MHPHYDLIMKWAKNPQNLQVQQWNNLTVSWETTASPTWCPNTVYRVVPKNCIKVALENVQDGQVYCYELGAVVYTRFSIPADNYGNPRSNKFNRSFGISNNHKLDTCRLPNQTVYLIL